MPTLALTKHEVSPATGIIFQALFGSLFIALCALIKIPATPVPITGQTFALFMLALYQRPSTCFASVCLYLLEATCGLPVLCGHINPLWLLSPHGGYLIAFPFATYLISSLKLKLPSKTGLIFSIFMGQIVIYTLGFLWLWHFLGAKTAFIGGVLFFIPSAIFKNFLAAGIYSLFKK
jgi:biotin transport system substrate-specific component